MNKNKKTDELNCRKYIANVVGADDSVCPKKQRGITLIALVITIIVMLILVSVTVSIAINGGLFGTAKQATVEMRASQVEEQVETWKAAKEASNYIEGSSVQTLEELLNDLEAQNLITKEEKAEIEENGQITIGTKNIVFLDISDYVYVGDYVNYEPQSETTSYKVEGIYSGYTDEEGNPQDQEINQDKLKWRVLNINDNGTVDLISDTPTTTMMELRLSLGYNNGVYLLNSACNTLYSNSNYNSTARNLNIEDVKDKMDLTVWDYHNFSPANYIKYGTAKTYETNRVYPYQWTQQTSDYNAIDGELTKGKLSQSEQYEPTLETYNEAKESITVTQTYWYHTFSQNNFNLVKTRIDEKDSNVYYNLFFPQGDYIYFLASRFEACGDTHAWGGLYFSRPTGNCGSCGGIGFNLAENTDSPDKSAFIPHPFRPVVTLPIGHIDLSTNYEEAGAWNLK